MPAIFPTADEMRAIAGPVVQDAIDQLGSIATLYERGAVEQADASSIIGFTGDSIEGIGIRLTELTSEKAQEIFGLNAVSTMKGVVMRDETIGFGWVFEVTGGDFLGRTLEVREMIENPLSDSLTLGLVDFDGATP